jgi:hypothetical protein
MRIKVSTIIQGGSILITTKMALFQAIVCIVRVGTKWFIQGGIISITSKMALFQAIVCIVRVGTKGFKIKMALAYLPFYF